MRANQKLWVTRSFRPSAAGHGACLWAVVLFAGVHAAAQTNPATRPADLSSPGATLTTAYLALKAGDIALARTCLAFKDAAQEEVFDITYTQLYRPMKLMHVMGARFGAAGRKPFANAPLEKSLDELLEKVKATEFQMTGEKAAVLDKKAAIDPSAETPLTGIRFQKEGAQWKIVAATFTDAGGSPGDVPANQLQFMRLLRDTVIAACQATEARLERGDFKTADEAFADYQARMAQGTKAAAAAATQKGR